MIFTKFILRALSVLVIVFFSNACTDQITRPSENSPSNDKTSIIILFEDNNISTRKIARQVEKDYPIKKTVNWLIKSIDRECYVYQISAQEDVDSVIANINSDPRVQIAEKINLFTTMGVAYDDPYFKLQYGLQLINADRAHKISTGKGIKMAIIDTGVDTRHPDLKHRIKETRNMTTYRTVMPGINYSRYSSFINSRDVYDIPPVKISRDYHGTAIAGVIVAIPNNKIGIVGVSPDVELLVLQACKEIPESITGVCNTYTLARALDYAIDKKVKIINMSLTGPYDPVLEILINEAIRRNITVVSSAGEIENKQSNFPASMPGVIAARSSVIEQGNFKSISVQTDTVNAPGDEIVSTTPNSNYNYFTGSSFAAAHVSGAVALLLQLDPSLTPHQVKQILLASHKGAANKMQASTIDICDALEKLNQSSRQDHC